MNQLVMLLLCVGLGLFLIGMTGLLLRRNPLALQLSLILMMAGVSGVFLAFSLSPRMGAEGRQLGQWMAGLVMALVCLQVCVGVPLLIALFHHKKGSIEWEQ